MDGLLNQQQPQQQSGLLNFLQSPQMQGMAEGLLAASGPSRIPVSMGQAMGMGMQRGRQLEDRQRSQQLQDLQLQKLIQGMENDKVKRQLLIGLLGQGAGLPGGNSQSTTHQGGDRASRVAELAAYTGDPSLMPLANFMQGQIEKSPEYIEEVAGRKKTAELEASKRVTMPKARSALIALEQQANVVTDNINKALDTVSPLSTGYGTFLDVLPNTDARKLKNYLDTIRANVGFDKLQEMRDNSPTGGALGQVSDLENKLLQATSGALDPAQRDQLEDNLKIIRDIYPKVLQDRKNAFAQDYGDVPPSSAINPPSISEGVENSDPLGIR